MEQVNGAGDQKPLAVNGLSGPARRSSKGKWTQEEDEILRESVRKYEGKCWKKIAACLPDRTDIQCMHRWAKVLNPNMIKGPWSKEEDNILIELVGKHGMKKWCEIEKHLPGRIGKQCRERWSNHLNPDLNKAAWTKEEENILINAHAVYGNRWSEIAKLLPGRSENSLKNHWNCSLKKKLNNYYARGFAQKPIEAKQDPSTKCYVNQSLDSEKNEDLGCPGLVCGNSGRSPGHLPSSEDGYLNSPPEMSCSVSQTRHSDVGDNLGELGPGSAYRSYTGLCYEPVQKADLNVFLSTGKFPGADSYVHQPYISPELILRNAAMSYDNLPSIIRRRAINFSKKCPSTPEEVKKEDDDQIRGSELNVLFSTKYPKLGRLAAIKSVGKSLEKAFSDA